MKSNARKYSILANVQCVDEKGKARADSQLPESIGFKSDGSDCGDEASIDGDGTSQ